MIVEVCEVNPVPRVIAGVALWHGRPQSRDSWVDDLIEVGRGVEERTGILVDLYGVDRGDSTVEVCRLVVGRACARRRCRKEETEESHKAADQHESTHCTLPSVRAFRMGDGRHMSVAC